MTEKNDMLSGNNQNTRPLVSSKLLLVSTLVLMGMVIFQAINLRNIAVDQDQYYSGPEQNIISEELMKPRLLNDSEEMKKYIEDFPVKDYEIAYVPGAGKFYVDSKKDSIKDALRRGKMHESYIVRQLTYYIREGSTVIDAGAYIGTHTVVMAKLVGPNGRVYAFEPQKKIFRELYYNLKLNNLENGIPLRFALGDTPGIIEMDIPPEGNAGGTHVGSGGDKAELRDIDSFHFKNVSLMKIDVESYEDSVLDGAKNTILSSKPVILVEIQGGYKYDTAPEHIKKKVVHTIKKIMDFGYNIIAITVYDYLCLPVKNPNPA